MGKLLNGKNSSSGCGTYVQNLVAGYLHGICPVFVAWIWWQHHNKGTVDRRLSTIALGLSLARLKLGQRCARMAFSFASKKKSGQRVVDGV